MYLQCIAMYLNFWQVIVVNYVKRLSTFGRQFQHISTERRCEKQKFVGPPPPPREGSEHLSTPSKSITCNLRENVVKLETGVI